MTVGAGLVVANLYYSQPLLNQIAATFHVTETEGSQVPLFTQLGYAVGLLFIVPLGDKVAHKKIIVIDFAAIILSLLAAALAPQLWILIAAGFLIGITSVIPQLFVPMAAALAGPREKGRAIGTVMSGLLIGILASRFISGSIGSLFGWREMYFIAAGLMLLLWGVLYVKLPLLPPSFSGTYRALIVSVFHYFKTEPVLRLAALRGSLGFASFSIFWTTLVFVLKDSFNYGSGVAGAFGLLGIIGALAASVAGRFSDRLNKNMMITFAIIVMISSWLVMLFSSHVIAGLVAGVLLLDLGLQSMHIANQNIIFSNNPEARNRVNTVYMVIYFIGGAMGTAMGAWAWQYAKWTGVSLAGLACTLFAFAAHLLFAKRLS